MCLNGSMRSFLSSNIVVFHRPDNKMATVSSAKSDYIFYANNETNSDGVPLFNDSTSYTSHTAHFERLIYENSCFKMMSDICSKT